MTKLHEHIFSIKNEPDNLTIRILGIKIKKDKGKKILKNIFKKPIFRNDDVSVDSNLDHLKEFSEVFHKKGYTLLHGVNLYGYTNCNFVTDDVPTPYEGYKNLSTLDYETIKNLSEGKFIGDNKELLNFLNSSPDEIALHGLYHTDYSKMTALQQEEDIKEGLRLLKELLPNKKVKVFIAPFNRTNSDTYKVCKKLGLKVSALEGKHLEEMIELNQYGISNGEIYRFHHHRFYPESTFDCYDLSVNKLELFLNAPKRIKRKLPSIEILKTCVEKNDAQPWYVYAFTDFKAREHNYKPYQWISKNVNKNANILETGCGAGGILYHLYKDGFKHLSGYDYDEKAVNAAINIAENIYAPIKFSINDGTNPKLNEKYDVIIGLSWIYLLSNFSLEEFLEKHLSYLNAGGYFVFELIDEAYNNVDKNQWLSGDWNKPENERAESEYKMRYSQKQIEEIAKHYNFDVVKVYDMSKEIISRKVYILKQKKNLKSV